jgi:hypothetical protein
MTRKKRRGPGILSGLIIFAALSVVLGWSWHSLPGYDVEPGIHVVEKAFYDQQSDLMVEVTGQVVRVVRPVEGHEGHQEFQLRLPKGQLLMVVRNTSAGDRVPLESNDRVTVRGNYQWSELGGVIHGAQRDYSLDRMHGWVELDGKKYD